MPISSASCLPCSPCPSACETRIQMRRPLGRQRFIHLGQLLTSKSWRVQLINRGFSCCSASLLGESSAEEDGQIRILSGTQRVQVQGSAFLAGADWRIYRESHIEFLCLRCLHTAWGGTLQGVCIRTWCLHGHHGELERMKDKHSWLTHSPIGCGSSEWRPR